MGARNTRATQATQRMPHSTTLPKNECNDASTPVCTHGPCAHLCAIAFASAYVPRVCAYSVLHTCCARVCVPCVWLPDCVTVCCGSAAVLHCAVCQNCRV
eukprot:8792519-Alexandrium_andersonii.AAC.1